MSVGALRSRPPSSSVCSAILLLPCSHRFVSSGQLSRLTDICELRWNRETALIGLNNFTRNNRLSELDEGDLGGSLGAVTEDGTTLAFDRAWYRSIFRAGAQAQIWFEGSITREIESLLQDNYHSHINFHCSCNPERICEPRLIIAINKTFHMFSSLLSSMSRF